MPAALLTLLLLIGAVFLLLLALLTYEKAVQLWRRHRHDSGKPDLRRYPPPDSDEWGQA
jgi:hypothetical protein